METNIVKCSNCPAPATWSYMPGDTNYCDNCVPRGCSCNHEYIPAENLGYPGENPPEKNWKWIVPGVSWAPVDELGREWPCCEYFKIK